jgi:hypothetical protein
MRTIRESVLDDEVHSFVTVKVTVSPIATDVAEALTVSVSLEITA